MDVTASSRRQGAIGAFRRCCIDVRRKENRTAALPYLFGSAWDGWLPRNNRRIASVESEPTLGLRSLGFTAPTSSVIRPSVFIRIPCWVGPEKLTIRTCRNRNADVRIHHRSGRNTSGDGAAQALISACFVGKEFSLFLKKYP